MITIVVFALVLSLGSGSRVHAAEPPAKPLTSLQYLPVGSQCRGFLPCDKSGDFGIHLRLLGAISLDEQHIVRSGLLAPSLIVSALEAGECGVAFPLRFYELGLPVPERLRVFCKVSLPKSLLPASGAALFVNVNLAYGPFNEAAAPSGARSTTVDLGGVLGGSLGSVVHLAAAVWTTVGEARPQLHAGPELRVRTDFLILFAQAQFYSSISDSPSNPVSAWGLLGTLGMSLPSAVAPTSIYVSLGRGEAAPWMLIAMEGGLTYDVQVRARYGDGHESAERFWDGLVAPFRYRLQLRRRGYYDPYPDEQGFLRDDVDHSVLGIVGVPDPTRPGYILTPFGIAIPVGASLEIRGDRPFVASPLFPGRVLSYIPLLALTKDGGTMPQPFPDELYFARLEDERRREELAVQDALRQLDSPWAKAALNAAAGLLTEHVLIMLAAASPDTPDLDTLRRQTRLAPYRPGYEEYKGEQAETALATYSSLLGPWAAGMLHATAVGTARELTLGLAALRTREVVGAASRKPRLLTHVVPRLDPANYSFELRGLGSNFGNVKVTYVGTSAEKVAVEAEQISSAFSASAVNRARSIRRLAAEEVAEHLAPPELSLPVLSDKGRAHIYFGDLEKGKSTGWHYEPTGDANQGTYVVEPTRSATDANGVYQANVYIGGVKKKAFSSFFPYHWTKEEIENAIEQAYRTRQLESQPNRYKGRAASGVEILMEIDKNGRISTAYPRYLKR